MTFAGIAIYIPLIGCAAAKCMAISICSRANRISQKWGSGLAPGVRCQVRGADGCREPQISSC